MSLSLYWNCKVTIIVDADTFLLFLLPPILLDKFLSPRVKRLCLGIVAVDIAIILGVVSSMPSLVTLATQNCWFLFILSSLDPCFLCLLFPFLVPECRVWYRLLNSLGWNRSRVLLHYWVVSRWIWNMQVEWLTKLHCGGVGFC